MAGKPSKPMTPFDKSVTPSYLYKWKLFLAFLPPSIQRFLAVYIKFTEFRYTMDYFRGNNQFFDDLKIFIKHSLTIITNKAVPISNINNPWAWPPIFRPTTCGK